jgi:penicillin-binding protein 2
VLGYLQSDDSSATGEPAFRYRLQDYRGVVGIEGAFDDDLRGVAGEKAVLVNNLGYRQSENVWSPAEPGRNVVLTLDVPTQQAAERALRSLGPETRGAIVVMDPNSGDIYAMASSPVYDPNVWLSPITTNQSEFLNDPKLRPQINRAVQGYYPPGSIFKVVTSLALLEHGLKPEEEYAVEPNPQNPAKGAIHVGNRLIHDTVSPGQYNFRRAFAKSSNSYFIHSGLQMPNCLDEILRVAQMLHLGERTGLPTKQEVPGSVPTREWRAKHGIAGWTDGDTANVCIGQGPVTVTPLQMAVMTSAIANGGTVYWPRLVSRTEPQDPLDDSPIRTVPKGRVRDTLHVTRRTIDLIRDGMLADVEDPEGTGKRADVPGWNLCGKTGSAEVQKGNVTVDRITWFASYAPYESPRYVVVVMVESGSSGGLTCAPLAQQIYLALQKREKASTLRRGPGSAAQAAPAAAGLVSAPSGKYSTAP